MRLCKIGTIRPVFTALGVLKIECPCQDGSGQCDIVAGGVDATGVFKGIYVPT